MKSIFVSSTFRDMHYERDVLNKRIAPKINRLLSQYNQSVSIIDLRWGVDTSELSEQEASERVLEACNSAIDNCKPYFVLLLGDRYGYIPSGSDISVTHMEILRGIVDSLDREHVYIYLRDADYTGMPDELRSVYVEQNKAATEHLDKLKALLLEIMPERCRRYKSVWSEEEKHLVSEDFEDLIIADLENDLIREKSLIRYRSNLHKQLSENEEILLDNLKYAYFDKEQLNAKVEEIKVSQLPTGIIGDGGSGKSVYMSLLCSALRKEGFKATVLFCGDNAFSSSVRNAAEALLCAIFDACGKNYDYEACASLSYDEIITRINAEKNNIKTRFYFMLDAVEKCDEGMLNFILWCGSFLNNRISIVFFARMTDKIEKKKAFFKLSEIIYDREDYRKIAECILGISGKSLHPSLIEAVLDKTKTPLQLQFIISKLLNMDQSDFEAIDEEGGSMDARNSRLKQIIDDTDESLDWDIEQYLSKLLLDICRINGDIFEFEDRILIALAFCDYGISEDALRAIVEMSNIKWVELYYLSFLDRYSFLIKVRDNGRLYVSHDIFRTILKQMYEALAIEICPIICKHYLEKDEPDELSVRTFFRAALYGRQTKFIVDFLEKHALSSDRAVNSVIDDCITQIFLEDNGEMLLECISDFSSDDRLQIFHFVLMISLLSISDIYPEDVIINIAKYLQILLIFNLQVPDTLIVTLDLKITSFLEAHRVSKEKIDSFRADYQKMITQLFQSNDSLILGNLKDSYEHALKKLRKAEKTEKLVLFKHLLHGARNLGAQSESAELAKYILNHLLLMLDNRELDVDNVINDALYADVYSARAMAYRTLEKWERGSDDCQRSIEINKRIYESCPSPTSLANYCAALIDLAHMLETQIINTKDDPRLWRRACECYKIIYEQAQHLISNGIEDLNQMQIACAIVSYGVSLLYVENDKNMGIEKCVEGVNMLLGMAQNSNDPYLYYRLCLSVLQCIPRLFLYGEHTIAIRMTADIYEYLRIVASSDNSEISDFANRINDLCTRTLPVVQTLIKRGDILVVDLLLDLFNDLSREINPLPFNFPTAAILLFKCQTAEMLIKENEDYERTYRICREALDNTTIKANADDDADPQNYVKGIAISLVYAYCRCITCLERLERRDELNKLIREGERRGRFYADHIDDMKGNMPGVFLMMYEFLSRWNSPSAPLFLKKAHLAISSYDFNAKAHWKTVVEIYSLMKKI